MRDTIKAARALRSSMTGVELLLWSRIRARRLGGHRFRRQVPLGPYIADYACLQVRLLVEVDGPSHEERFQYDEGRTEWLEKAGFRVLRFQANDVLARLDEVLETILRECDRPPSPASPGTPPAARGRDRPR